MLHKLIHLLGMQREFRDMWEEDGWIYRADVCIDCGRRRNQETVIITKTAHQTLWMSQQDYNDIVKQ